MIVIELDVRTREMLEEVRDLGRRYIRDIGLEADRSASPPPIDHPFYLICARQGGLVGRMVGEDEGPTALDWKPVRNFLLGEEAAYWDRGVALSLPGPGLGGPALRSTATPEQRQRVMAIYAAADAAVAAAGPRCDSSGRCCRFTEYGHTLFISQLEADVLLAAAPPFEGPVSQLLTNIVRRFSGPDDEAPSVG